MYKISQYNLNCFLYMYIFVHDVYMHSLKRKSMNSNYIYIYIYIYITKKNEGLVYLEESGFLKITFQTFLYSFVIRKNGQ